MIVVALKKKKSVEWKRTRKKLHSVEITQCDNKSLQFSCSVVSDSLQPHGLQHVRLPCPSPTPEACSNSCPSSLSYHPTISSSAVPFSPCFQSFPSSGSFSNELALHIKWSKYWGFSFSISPSKEYSGLISFRVDCSLQEDWTRGLYEKNQT